VELSGNLITEIILRFFRRITMKSYKVLGTVLIFLSIILGACSGDKSVEKEHKFYGESDNWVVEYENEVTEEREFGEFTIEYIGEEPTPEVFGYSIKSASLNLEMVDITFNQDNQVHSGNTVCGTGCEAYTTENANIIAELEWEGETEIINLDSIK
jgi:hypothetical protein